MTLSDRRSMRFPSIPLFILLFILTGCARVPPSGEDLAAEMWNAQLDLKVGSIDEPDYALTWFRALTVSESGRIFTAHGQEQAVRIFEPDGTLARVIGGRGSGPGEFQNLGPLGWVGDTLWVLDFSRYRFNLFSEEGDFLSSFTVPFKTREDRTQPSPPTADGLLSDGTVHGSPPAFSNEVESGSITHHEVLLLNRDGETTDSVARIPFGNNQWAVYDPENREKGMLFTRQPFGDGPLWGFIPNERALAVLTRTAPSTPEEAHFTLVELTLTGDTVFARDYRFEPDPIRAEEIDSILDSTAETWAGYGVMGGATAGRLKAWAKETMYTPALRAGVSQMVIGRNGGFWLSRTPAQGDSVLWLVLEPDGSPEGQVLLPKDVQVLQADPTTVWGTVMDEMDVPYLVRYRIVRQEAETMG